jgi:hypothetical protein
MVYDVDLVVTQYCDGIQNGGDAWRETVWEDTEWKA